MNDNYISPSIPLIDSVYTDKKNSLTVYNSKKTFGYYDNRKDNIETKMLLESKRPNIAEVELTLFENCDINCSFCHHDKSSIVGLDVGSMLSKVDIIEAFFRDRVGTISFMQINIVGGELFQDRLVESGFLDHYKVIAEKINGLAIKYNYDLNIVWVSNFLFSDSSKISQFLSEVESFNIKTSMILSYDFYGRPTSKIYYRNIRDMFTYISSVNIVATVDTIKYMMTNSIEYFAMILYNKIPVYIDDYIPDNISDDLTPPDSLMLKFYKFLLSNYPNIVNISELVNNETNPMGCLSLNKVTIFPDNSTSNCKWGRYEPKNFKTYENSEVDYNDNAPQMQRHVDYYGCLSCEFYSRCKFRCFTQWDFINPDVMDYDGCWIKSFFIHINSDKT